MRRDAVERVILDGIYRDLLEPERVARMSNEMRVAYAERMRAVAAHAADMPRELEELDARIMRLRERLKTGDPESLWAEYAMQPAALLMGSGAGTSGRDEAICLVPAVPVRARVR